MELTLAEKLSWGLNGFLVGIGCVFLVLLVLILLISVMGKIAQSGGKSKAKAPKANKKDLNRQVDDEDEIMAVITAAIACMSQREGKKYKICSYKRV